MVVAYKNRNTGQVVAFPGPSPRLEALDEWQRTTASEVTYSVADAHDRAAAERESIEAAAAIRLDGAQGAAARGIAASRSVNVAPDLGTQPQPLPTLSTSDAGEQQNLVTLLDKDDELRKVATTSFEENKRRADEEIAHPPTDGVLARAKRDHKTGATQIGPDPEDHAGPAAARAKGLDTDASPADAGVTGPGVDTGQTGQTGDGGPERPGASAKKDEWVEYAVSRGVSREEAIGLTIAQLQDRTA